MAYIVLAKPRDANIIKTYGPFTEYDEAYDFLAHMPNLAHYEFKYVEQLIEPVFDENGMAKL